MPVFLAFLIAKFIEKLPTTGPSRFLPSTKAVDTVSLIIDGSSFEFVVPAFTSRTYLIIIIDLYTVIERDTI